MALTDHQQARYEEIRAKGQSHSIAVMLASGHAPGAQRPDERWRGSDPSVEFQKKMPKGKYQAGLARYPGDHRAIVRSRGEARKRASELGLTIQDAPANSNAPAQLSKRRPITRG